MTAAMPLFSFALIALGVFVGALGLMWAFWRFDDHDAELSERLHAGWRGPQAGDLLDAPTAEEAKWN